MCPQIQGGLSWGAAPQLRGLGCASLPSGSWAVGPPEVGVGFEPKRPTSSLTWLPPRAVPAEGPLPPPSASFLPLLRTATPHLGAPCFTPLGFPVLSTSRRSLPCHVAFPCGAPHALSQRHPMGMCESLAHDGSHFMMNHRHAVQAVL